MTLTTERQQFEEWFHEEIVLHISTPNEAVVRLMWKAWQASRELLANREAQPSITDEAIDRIVLPLSPDGLDEEKYHCEWHLYHDRERIRKELREYFAAPPAPANANAVAWEMRYWNSGHNMWGEWERITAEQHAEMSVQHATDNDYEFRVLYDATPAPASEPIFFIEVEGDDWINAGRIPGSTFDFNNLPDGVNKLYAAPPAPAVPMEMTKEDAIAFVRERPPFKGSVECVQATWKACRAAMLAAAPGES